MKTILAICMLSILFAQGYAQKTAEEWWAIIDTTWGEGLPTSTKLQLFDAAWNIATTVQLVEMFIKKTSPALFRALGIFLPLITTNCAVLGVALLNINEQHSFIGSAVYGFGAALGFSLVLILFASLRERLAAADVPAPFQGASIAMITAGLMSLAFMGFTGLVKL